MAKVWCLLTLIIFFSLSDAVDPCEKHENCADCIRDPSVCVYCASNTFTGVRCISAKSETKNWCPDSLQYPENTVKIIENKDFSSLPGSVTQIRPQRFNIKLRPGIPVDIEFSFQAAVYYPVDMYFLLDASSTMEKIKHSIEEQSINIYKTMNALTNNIQIGLGTFVDKNTLPYTDQIDSKLTYSFKNRLKITNDPEKFKEAVHTMPFGNNSDEPEGGLDALAQVIICGQKIGWRNESRKIIIFLTDGSYHTVGDGVQGGIFQPYDRKCYLDESGTYTKELEMDYPSVSIINRMAMDEEMTIIFTVKNEVRNQYSHLSGAIRGAKNTGLKNDLSKLLKEIYKDITRSLKLKINTESGQRNRFDIKFFPDCTDDSTICGVKIGQEMKFTSKVTLLEYFGVNHTTIDLMIEGIKEKITLDIDIIQDCDCVTKSIPNSKLCSRFGSLVCGMCQCNPTRYGDKCACTSKGLSKNNDTSTCIAPGDDKPCSRRGSCICGSCVCKNDSPYEGQFCQYNKNNCPRHSNNVCNGHGKCEGEKCICTDGWYGNACECNKLDDEGCINPTGKVCSILGACKCGKCVCKDTSTWDARVNRDQFCNALQSADCHKSQCNILEPCARCLQSGNGACSMCNGGIKFNVSLDLIASEHEAWNVCPDVRVDVGCYIRFVYKYDDDNYMIELVVQSAKNCLESYYMFGGVFLISLIVIGVATLAIWKCLTDAQDRREYEEFLILQQQESNQECCNPIYKSSSTTTKNPVFRKMSEDLK